MSGDTKASCSALGAWLTASTINSTGTVATASVLPIVIFRATRNPAAVSLLAVIKAGPYLLLGIAAGYLADRINRQRLIVAGFVGAAVVAVVQATGLLSGTHLALIYGCALLAATIFVITDAAEFGLLPRVINTGQLPRAWGLSSALADGCAVAVPPLATTVVAITGAAPVLACDALSFLVASALIARLRPRAEPTGNDDATEDMQRRPPHQPDDWRAGARFIWSHPTLRPLVVAGLLNSAGFGAVTALLVVYAVQALGLRPTGVQVGVVLAATSAGSIGAGVAFSRIYRPSRVRLLSCVGTLGCALCVAALADDRSASMAVAVLVCYGVFLAVTITTGIVYRRR